MPDHALVVEDPGSATLNGQSKMVIPKMTRPPAASPVERPSTPPSLPISVVEPPPVAPPVERVPAAPPVPISAVPPPSGPLVERPPAPPQTPISAEPASTNDAAAAQYVAPPILEFTPEITLLTRFGPQIGLAVVALLGLGLLLWGYSATDSSSHKLIEWSHRYSSPPGRLLFLYQPSRGDSDYRLEFAWVPNAKSVGWVLREHDENNYDAARLILQKPAPDMVLAEEHFSMLGGVEGPHSRKVISLGKQSGAVQIQMDAMGSAYTLSLQGKPVDSWTDTQLNSGAMGFFDETGERPQVQGVYITLTGKGATRSAVASLP
ncbi:MAG TPA: hypothetical protein VLM42_08620 [Bryobacteraceae bacterium]|nr:hypothetical protein [Bryobacteraceae bacterium]